MSFLGRSQRRQFESLVEPLLRPLFRAALRRTRQTEWAEDLTQDTLIRAYERFGQFSPGTNFRAWLFTILTHLYLNDCERARRRPVTISLSTDGAMWDMAAPEALHDPEALLLTHVMDEDLEAALERLPEEFRIAILLVDVEEMTYQEAAYALGVPIGTVRSRVSRGRALLRRLLHTVSL
jgi:RNA polymerase sigma-70 factor (ECF subfamily)